VAEAEATVAAGTAGAGEFHNHNDRRRQRFDGDNAMDMGREVLGCDYDCNQQKEDNPLAHCLHSLGPPELGRTNMRMGWNDW